MSTRGKKLWDNAIKRLVFANPQDFVSWLVKGATFKSFKSIEFKNRTIEADIIMEIVLDGEVILLHIEFQSDEDENMAQRLLEYNVLASRLHERRILSCVIYLRPEKNVAVSPLLWTRANGELILEFRFVVLKLWEIAAEEIIQTGLVGLLPLLPLTKEGKQHRTVERMIEKLASAKKMELLQLGAIFAGLTFESDADRAWLKERFEMYESILEESWVYQEILRKGELKGEENACQKQKETLLKIVQGRFPNLIELAQKQITNITDLQRLQDVIVQISLAKSEKAASAALLAASKKQESTEGQA